MADRRIDMSSEAVARRLEAMGQLYRLGLSLKHARHLGPVTFGTGPPVSADSTRLEVSTEDEPDAADPGLRC